VRRGEPFLLGGETALEPPTINALQSLAPPGPGAEDSGRDGVALARH